MLERLIAVQLDSSVVQSCPTLYDPMNCSTPGLPVHPNSQSLPKLMSIESVMPSNHLILCRPLPLLPSIFPSIRVFSEESVLRIRWPKFWSFSFSISLSNEYSGLISFRTDWFDPLQKQQKYNTYGQREEGQRYWQMNEPPKIWSYRFPVDKW